MPNTAESVHVQYVPKVFSDTQCIIEYGSTPYVGMTQKKNGGPIKRVQN